MKTRIVTGPESLHTLRDAWNRLEHSAVSPMQQFIWSNACASAFTLTNDLRVLVVEEGDTVMAIAPLVLRKSRLEMLGVTELHEPTDVLYSDAGALTVLANALLKMGIPLALRRLPADSLLPAILEKSFRGRGAVFFQRDSSWPFIPLDARWMEPESQLNSGRRSDFRRMQRIAGEMGAVTSEVVTPTLETLPALLDEAFAVEAASWKGEVKSAMLMDPVRGAFYRQYATAACEKGILRLCFLRIGAETAAMQLTVDSGGRLWLLKIGYDKRFARCSPGILLLRETLRHCAANGLQSMEFLGTSERWIKAWTWMERSCVAVRAYPLGLRGASALARDAVTSACYKLSRLARLKK